MSFALLVRKQFGSGSETRHPNLSDTRHFDCQLITVCVRCGGVFTSSCSVLASSPLEFQLHHGGESYDIQILRPLLLNTQYKLLEISKLMKLYFCIHIFKNFYNSDTKINYISIFIIYVFTYYLFSIFAIRFESVDFKSRI